MRTLRFIVYGEHLELDPSCDFTGLFPKDGSEIRAEFAFSPEWKSRVKVAEFWSMLDKAYPFKVLEDDNSCLIPEEALARPVFKVQILGKYKGCTFETNQCKVYQRG